MFITIFRSVATSDCWAPTAATSARARRLSETETHNYANFPGMAHGNHMNSDDKNFLPGIYAVSLYKCLLGLRLLKTRSLHMILPTDGPLMLFVMYCHQKNGDLFVLNSCKGKLYIKILGFSKEID